MAVYPSAHYTCPMHPEVRSDNPGSCPKCGMALVPVREHGRAGIGGEMDRDVEQGWKALNTAGRYALIGFLLIAGFFLVTEHRAHLYGALPFLLLLACPLLHLFHRHGERSRDDSAHTQHRPH